MWCYMYIQNGQTPLYIASTDGHGAVVKVLLEDNADVSISEMVCKIESNMQCVCLYLVCNTGWLDSTNGSIT